MQDDSYFDLASLWNSTTSGSGQVGSSAIWQIWDDLKSQPEQPHFLMAPRTYNTILWSYHIAKAYRLPSRKLRKCQLRRRTKRMQRDRKRYL